MFGIAGGIDVVDAAGNSNQSCLQPIWRYAEAQTLTNSGGWTVANCNCWMNGNTLKSSTKGAWVSVQLGGDTECTYGSSAALVGDKASGRGTANVLVDGTKVGTISEAGSTTNRVVLFQKRYKGFPPKLHTVKIVVASGRFDIDGIEWELGWNTNGCGG